MIKFNGHVDKDNSVTIIYLDFQKALDKVPHLTSRATQISAASAADAREASSPDPCLERVCQAMGSEATGSLNSPAKRQRRVGEEGFL